MDVPFHTDIRFLAQRCRGLLRDPHQAKAQARRLPLRRRPASRDQSLPRSAQSAAQALHMDRRSRQNHRRRQARAPSVRFDPLVYDQIGRTWRLLGLEPKSPTIVAPMLSADFDMPDGFALAGGADVPGMNLGHVGIVNRAMSPDEIMALTKAMTDNTSFSFSLSKYLASWSIFTKGQRVTRQQV